MVFASVGFVAATFRPVAAAESKSDEMLIKQIASGDQLAMRTLFARHRLRMYRFVLRMVRDEALAEDILSEVFLDVWRKADQFEARAAVSTWLLAIARFKALSAMRRQVDVELDNEMGAVTADPADNPEVALQHKNNAEILRRSLVKLSPAHGEVIDLVYYHSKSVKEVAEIVGISEATVKTRMFYARKKLADLVHEVVSATLH
jgi:RNA polymerase sigma-70 factor (ECF subfamily)